MRITQALKGAVQIQAAAVATIDADYGRTWREVGERVARGASILQALGVGQGDRVAVLALNNDRYLELLFAVPWAGAAIVPLNTRWAVAEVEQALRDCGAKVLLVDRAFAGAGAQLQQRIPSLRMAYIGSQPCPEGFVDYEAELEKSRPVPDSSGSGDELWGIFYTGGTTGYPKGVMLSHANMVVAALTWIPTMHFSQETRYLHLVGFFHIAGAQPAVALTMAAGTHVIEPKFEAVAGMSAIARHEVNYCLFVPTMLNMLLHHPEFPKYDLTSVQYCEYGGAPMPDSLISLALEKLPTWKFIQGYGQTEATGLVASLPWARHFGDADVNKRKAAGRAAYGIELRVVDPSGEDVRDGTAGEIIVHGPTVMLGYWGNTEATSTAIRDGWLYTGDVARIDKAGFLYIVDRLKDMIVSGGENVSSKEVENVIHKHPTVQECAVIGIPDPKWGEAVHAVVVLKAGASATQASIIDHCHTLIAGFKCPRSVEFRSAMPLSAAGKIMKGSLRDAHWVGQDRRVN
jgi:long-chain acyl-CoA synthetase